MLSNSNKFILFILIIGLFGILFLACGSNERIRENIPNVSEKSKTQEFAIDHPDTTLYLISPGDNITLEVFQRSNLKQIFPVNNFIVQETGLISVPLLGDIHVEGSTLPEIKDEIYNKLSKIMVEPIFNVTITQRSKQKVLVAGEVSKPGIYPLDYGTSALEAILLAGGFSKDADKSLVVLIRTHPKKDGEESNAHALSMNIDQYLHETKFDQNVILKRGDIVYVPDSYEARSDRFWTHVSTVIRPFAETIGVVSSIVILSNTSRGSD